MSQHATTPVFEKKSSARDAAALAVLLVPSGLNTIVATPASAEPEQVVAPHIAKATETTRSSGAAFSTRDFVIENLVPQEAIIAKRRTELLRKEAQQTLSTQDKQELLRVEWQLDLIDDAQSADSARQLESFEQLQRKVLDKLAQMVPASRR